MSVLEWVLRVGLAAVFATAGVAKLVDRAGTRRAMVDFGVPDQAAGPVAVALPLAEVGTAALLVIPATAWWGALAALVLLAAFTVVITANLGAGRTPDCHCFGQLTRGPLSKATLWRNLALAVPALILVLTV